MSQQKVEYLIKLLCSTFYISRYSDDGFSVPELAIDLHKVQGSYTEERDKSLLEFDGYTFEDIETPTFQNRKKRLKKKRDGLANSIKSNVPVPVKKEYSLKDEPIYQQDESAIDVTNNALIKKWYDRFISLGGNSCYKFGQADIMEAKKRLLKIARFQIKFEAMKEVSDVASLEGKYTFYKEFDKVPDACEYYSDQLGDDFTKGLLKEKIKKHASIYENGEVLDDWSVINKRINSWLHHEENKYKR